MKRIQVNSAISTNLRSEFSQINYIEIEDTPFSEGAFGEVFYCKSVNGKTPSMPQVIKLFKESFQGSLDHNSKTIERLQVKLDKYNRTLLKQINKTLFEEFPAFKGVPQFSFKGVLNGKTVTGFSADNLVSLGFNDFEKILEDPIALNQYHSFPVERRMLLAFQLVSAFKVLEEFFFIHADMKPAAIFINLATYECAIIDYDSGVITENQDDEPNTWGAPGDWVAPEVWQQLSKAQRGDKIQVDLYTDRWSVAIGIHYLMSTVHPLFYLTELSPRISKQYFGSTQWFNANKNAPYFNKDNEQHYDRYVQWISTAIPKQIRDKISQTINFGYREPVKRTSYSEWKVALQSIQEPPKQKFTTNRTAIIKGVESTLNWEVENAYSIELITFDMQSGLETFRQALTDKGSLSIRPSKDTKYRLLSTGYFGQTPPNDIDIQVFPTPILERLVVPIPDFNRRVNLNPIQIGAPNINVSLKHNFITDTPNFTKPSFDLLTIRATHKPKRTTLYLSGLFERITKQISGKK
jgi:serine/threonine protein kinase